MTTDWTHFLESQGMSKQTREADDGQHSKIEWATLNGNTITDLSHLGLLEISGADATTFLQGQVTNDVKQLENDCAHYTGYCNPQGRLLALFLAFKQQQKLYLQCRQEVLSKVSQRLKMYVLRSQVRINDVSNDWVRIGLSGTQIATLLAPLFETIPIQPYVTSHTENSTLIRLPGRVPRYEIVCGLAQAKAIWLHLGAQCTPVGSSVWEWLEIQAGIPDIALLTQEAFVPQMVNLDLLGGIHFKKGCYTGQEIVARTHYLGTIKRRTQYAHLNSATMPAIGDDILDGAQQTIGKIVRCAPAMEGGFDVLAECRLESVTQGAVYWRTIALEIKPLPYALEVSKV